MGNIYEWHCKKAHYYEENAVLYVYQRGYTGSYGVICYDMALDVSVCNKINDTNT